MSKSLAVINCSQLVTLAGPARPRVGSELLELGIVSSGALFVRGTRIEKVGSRKEIEALVDDECEVVDAGGRIVLPGFVDAHTHPVFAGTRVDEFEERSKRRDVSGDCGAWWWNSIDCKSNARGEC